MTVTTTSDELQAKFAELRNFSVCDVSDALLKLDYRSQNHRAGYLADLKPITPSSRKPVIGIASTFKFISKSSTATQSDYAVDNLIPKTTHWADCVKPETVVVIEQPAGQHCAAVGGIMATRMSVLGAKGVIVAGRVRDLDELEGSRIPIWSRATSTVGSGAESKPLAKEVPVDISGVPVNPGDIIYLDPNEGAVVIQRDILDDVLALMPKIVAADNEVKKAVQSGMPVFEAFQKFRR
ncbi:hypothetical protein KEM54_005342 [Ascosphaera aggregata]|nr:hypothetical protein KEM54_005342 [Ascosphaera aggregata]